MKKCVPRKSVRVLGAGVIVCSAAAALWAFHDLFYGDQAPAACLLMGFFFGGAALYLLYSMVSLGNWGYFYDEEKIIFVLSRKDRREFRWEQLQKAGVSYPGQAGYFYFQGGKKIGLNPQMEGYEQLIAMLRKKGLSAAQASNFVEVDPKDVFQQIFGQQFGKGGKK